MTKVDDQHEVGEFRSRYQTGSRCGRQDVLLPYIARSYHDPCYHGQIRASCSQLACQVADYICNFRQGAIRDPIIC